MLTHIAYHVMIYYIFFRIIFKSSFLPLMYSAVKYSIRSYPAMLFAKQLEHHWYTLLSAFFIKNKLAPVLSY